MTAENPEFSISLKTPHSWLVEHSGNTDIFARQIATDIKLNAEELEPGIVWPDVYDAVYWVHSGTVYRGTGAIQRMSSRTVGFVAKEMGWSMDSSPMVYMSAHAFINPVNVRLAKLAANIKAAEEGSRKFPDEETKAIRLARESSELAKLSTFNKRLTDSAEAYADVSGLPREGYREFLKKMLITGHGSVQEARRRALTKFKSGDVSGANEIMSDLAFYDRDVLEVERKRVRRR